MRTQYPVLSELLGEYFHDGWAQDAHLPGSRRVIDVMIRRTPKETLQTALSELDELLASGVCEPQINDILQFELGCHVLSSEEGKDPSAWLMELRRVMSQAL